MIALLIVTFDRSPLDKPPTRLCSCSSSCSSGRNNATGWLIVCVWTKRRRANKTICRPALATWQPAGRLVAPSTDCPMTRSEAPLTRSAQASSAAAAATAGTVRQRRASSINLPVNELVALRLRAEAGAPVPSAQLHNPARRRPHNEGRPEMCSPAGAPRSAPHSSGRQRASPISASVLARVQAQACVARRSPRRELVAPITTHRPTRPIAAAAAR
jgi:hypothetical protein